MSSSSSSQQKDQQDNKKSQQDGKKQDGKQQDKDGKSKPRESVERPPLVYLTNKWIQELTQRIRARPIPWEGYHRADLLSAEELKMIKSVDAIVVGQDRSKLNPLLDEQGQDYVSLYLRLLSKLSRTDTLQQILVLIDDMLSDRDDRLELFLSLNGQEEQDGIGFPWRPFVKLLDVPDDFVQMKSAQFLTLLLVFSASHLEQPKPPSSVLPRLLTFLSSLLRGASQKPSSNSSGRGANASPAARRTSPDFAEGNGPEIALVLLESLLRTQKYREEAWEIDVAKMGQAQSSTGKGKSSKKNDDDDSDGDNDDQEQQHEDVDRGFLSELAYILRLSNAPAGGPSFLSSNSPAGSGSATPSRQTTSSNASTLVVGANNGTNTTRAGTQLVYQVVLCLWLLSFNADIAAELNVKLGLIPILVDVARNAVKEKVTRVTVATFRNLLAKAPDANAPVMLGSKCLTLTENLQSRKWSDDEINEDLEFLKTELSERLKTMTTWDEYLSELQSGQLTFESPCHEMDEFWKENAPKFVDEDGKVLKQLVKVLKESEDATTLSVACSDVGKFVHFFEQGKKRVGELGAKTRIMELMGHDDANVKYYALHTVGKLVSASWR
ncbi:ATPase, V1 complex, subunit H [Kalmanozyma brasiliensis GHG001]|uniref:ATPase V1 complex subunit H C-terminal domain-containing protein n=1 Tax=Kalmanozyma brasiliensis (strain GHG001) TaxID=1365824 RepID=V5EXN8_KALBG|nr:ATPase, V1 complex, subunit H [Kalmanozyma brasiliensis GHG001]EST08308.1 ATPase, V1 complex, subunit H [Kalmanozyma brasiliensis GHG001]